MDHSKQSQEANSDSVLGNNATSEELVSEDKLITNMTSEEKEKHMKLLHDYNELKDIGQVLLGKIALIENTTVKSLYPRYGLDLED